MKKHPCTTTWVIGILCCGCLLMGCDETDKPTRQASNQDVAKPTVEPEAPISQKTVLKSSAIVAAARDQIGKTKRYDPSYVRLEYPGGDVPIRKGVCTDVVIRALRDAFGMDLQKLVHEDMKAAFPEYPNIWGLKKPDRNIDHRRVPNVRRYFERKGYSIAVSKNKEDYLPGDVVSCAVAENQPHIMIVSDRKKRDGTPLVIHNIGRGTKENNRLFEFPLTGHYRIATVD
ncbi:hypothetical protein ES703_91760 [subsurface metagenome]